MHLTSRKWLYRFIILAPILYTIVFAVLIALMFSYFMNFEVSQGFKILKNQISNDYKEQLYKELDSILRDSATIQLQQKNEQVELFKTQINTTLALIKKNPSFASYSLQKQREALMSSLRRLDSYEFVFLTPLNNKYSWDKNDLTKDERKQLERFSETLNARAGEIAVVNSENGFNKQKMFLFTFVPELNLFVIRKESIEIFYERLKQSVLNKFKIFQNSLPKEDIFYILDGASIDIKGLIFLLPIHEEHFIMSDKKGISLLEKEKKNLSQILDIRNPNIMKQSFTDDTSKQESFYFYNENRNWLFVWKKPTTKLFEEIAIREGKIIQAFYGTAQYMFMMLFSIVIFVSITSMAISKILFNRFEKYRTHISDRLEHTIEQNKKLNNIILSQQNEIEVLDSYIDDISLKEPKTGCFNQIKALEDIKYQTKLIQRYDRKFSLALLDIDDSLLIIKAKGDEYYETLLRDLVSLVNLKIRSSDVLYLMANNNLLIFLSETDIDGAEIIINRMVDKIKDAEFVNDTTITLSVAVIEINKNTNKDGLEFLKATLKNIQENGGDNIVFDAGA